MYVDPDVVRQKVEREIEEYKSSIDHFRGRGIWILGYTFPELLVAFTAVKGKPLPLVMFGVLMDLSNYDVEPPSIRLVNPFTRAPLRANEIPVAADRLRLALPPGAVWQGALPVVPYLPAPPLQPVIVQAQGVQSQPLIQAWTQDDPEPFVCLPGVREYHDNPGHSGDSWWLHRGTGAGRILRLLSTLAQYATEPVTGVEIQMNLRISAQQQLQS